MILIVKLRPFIFLFDLLYSFILKLKLIILLIFIKAYNLFIKYNFLPKQFTFFS